MCDLVGNAEDRFYQNEALFWFCRQDCGSDCTGSLSLLTFYYNTLYQTDLIYSHSNVFVFQISLSKEDSLFVMYRWVELLWSSNEKVGRKHLCIITKILNLLQSATQKQFCYSLN